MAGGSQTRILAACRCPARGLDEAVAPAPNTYQCLKRPGSRNKLSGFLEISV